MCCSTSFLQMVTVSTPNKNNISLLHFAKSESPNLFAQICCFSDTREHSSPQSILQSQYLVQGNQGLGRAVLFSSGCHHTQFRVSLLGERSCFTKLGLLKRRRWVSKLVILIANLPLPGHLVSILGTVRLRTACQPALRRNRADQAASISPRSTSGQLFGPSAKKKYQPFGLWPAKTCDPEQNVVSLDFSSIIVYTCWAYVTLADGRAKLKTRKYKYILRF